MKGRKCAEGFWSQGAEESTGTQLVGNNSSLANIFIYVANNLTLNSSHIVVMSKELKLIEKPKEKFPVFHFYIKIYIKIACKICKWNIFKKLRIFKNVYKHFNLKTSV